MSNPAAMNIPNSHNMTLTYHLSLKEIKVSRGNGFSGHGTGNVQNEPHVELDR
jgi:hypothetical protein